MCRHVALLFVACCCLLAVAPLAAMEIVGQLGAVSGKDVGIVVAGDFEPQPGDKFTIVVDVPGVGEARVAAGQISRLDNGIAMGAITDATGQAATGQKVKIDSPQAVRKPGTFKNAAAQLPAGADGSPRTTAVGLGLRSVDQATAELLDLPNAQGCVVTQVLANSPAAAAGLKKRDVIRTAAGSIVADAAAFEHTLAAATTPTVKIDIWRNGATHALEIAMPLARSTPASGAPAAAVEAMTFPPLSLPAATQQIVQGVVKIVPGQHISAHPLDGEIARRTVDLFLDWLDSSKTLFLRADVDEFRRRSETLNDRLSAGDASLAFDIFNVVRQRLGQRMPLTDRWLAAKHDFAADEQMDVGKTASYAADEAQASEVWRKRVKYELLRRKVEGLDPEEARRRVARQYRALQRRFQQYSAEEVLETFLTCLTNAYDPLSTYLSPQSNTNQRIDIQGQLFGIGATLEMVDGQLTVKSAVPGGPAARDGRFKPGDRIVAVGQGESDPWVEIAEMKLADAVALIRGALGARVRLRVLQVGQFEASVIELVRAKIEFAQLGSTILSGQQLPDGRAAQLGYVWMPTFYTDMAAETAGQKDFRSSSRDLRKRLEDFRTRGVDLVLVDIRNNSGGALNEALRTAALFVGDGKVAQTRVRDEKAFPYNVPDATVAWEGPLVVLTNKYTAGGAEILAGAVADYQRGLVIGDRSTNGTGQIRSSFDVGRTLFGKENPPSLGFLLLTTGKLYRPGGMGIQARGIEPHVVLPSPTSMDEGSVDRPYALRYDTVPAAEFQLSGYAVSDALRQDLTSRSEERRAKAPYFEALARQLALAEQRKTKSQVPLKEDLYRAQFTPSPRPATVPKIPNIPEADLDAYVQEVLSVALDYASSALLTQAETSWSQGDYPRALELHRKAIGAEPSNAEAQYLLGWALSTCPQKEVRDGKTAVTHARKACEMDGRKAWRYLLGLAVAEAEAGSFDDAREHLRDALEKAPENERGQYQALEERFKAGSPMQDP